MKFSWKKNKVKKSHDFQRIIKEKKIISNDFFIFFYSFSNNCYRKNNLNHSLKVGISIPKKIVKKSYERNKYKRQIKNIIIDIAKKTKLTEKANNCKIVVIIKKNYINKEFDKKKESFLRITSHFLSLLRKNSLKIQNQKS